MNNKIALVTGATSGIGKALCRLLAKKGFTLLITGRNEAELDSLISELSPNVILKSVKADLTLHEGLLAVTEAIQAFCPTLVVNNAGFGLYGDALSYPNDEQEKIIDLNVKALAEIALEGARTLISNHKKGVVLNISSAAAFQIAPGMAVYAASKAFVNSFSQSLDEELKSYGVRVLAACPGKVDTSFSERAGRIGHAEKRGVMTPEYVAEALWDQLVKLKPLQIIDWKYRVLTALSYCVPRSWTASVFKKNIADRIVPRNLIIRPPHARK